MSAELKVAERKPMEPARLGFWPSWAHHIGDLVFGANDGVITTFAVVTGVSGASLSPRIAVVLGIANLLADGFSMGAGNYLAARSQQQYELTNTGQMSETRAHAVGHGAAIFVAFVLAGAMPIVPLLLVTTENALLVSSAAAGVTLFAVGGFRTVVTGGKWLVNGVEMLLVGSAAAAVAYVVGWLLRTLI